MLDPFRLASRLLIATFVIAGYLIACIIESTWYLVHNTRYRIGSAIGETLRGIVSAIADVFRR
jgi:hypothetical protein